MSLLLEGEGGEIPRGREGGGRERGSRRVERRRWIITGYAETRGEEGGQET